nr:MAG: putative RNA-dependent RNA polymerase [Mitoviridae sp.]
MKTSSQGRISSNSRWILKRELRVFMMLPVWLMGLRVIWKDCYMPMYTRILELWKVNGSLWVSQYLAQVSRIIVLWMNGVPFVQPTNGVRVRVTRYGLPLFLPGPLRVIFLQLRGDDHAYALRVIRVTLSALSVFRVIGCAPNLKLETIIGPFSGISATLPVWEVGQAVGMLPKALVIGKAAWTYMSESAGPNGKKSTWTSGLDALAFVRDPFTWYHWTMLAWAQGARHILAWQLLICLGSLPVIPLLVIKGMFPVRLGRLATLFEARGKVRVVAITDWWTQVLLKPLHLGIFEILREIREDGTFDQLGPIHRLLPYIMASGTKVFSYDLSAATDRLPVKFQVQVLEALGVSWACHWASLLVGRPWFLNGKPVTYSVGQPMGALSSWAMLALSHHILVQIAARRVGIQGWFPHYALLGDDIVIADEAVAGAYLVLMETLGVPINLSKSFEMSTGGLEFAKRWMTPLFGEISPMSPGLILASIRNPRIVPALILDSLGRGYVFSTRVCSDLYRFLLQVRPRKWLDRNWGPIWSMIIGPTGGLWETASGPYFKAVWIESFPHRVVNKLGKLVDTLYQQHAESQKSPLGEEDSWNLLVSNFWKQVMPTGSIHWGLLWLPVWLFSPAFWVYYDLASRAAERVLEFKAKRTAFREARWMGFVGDYFRDYNVVRGSALNRLVRSTFDPGLLDWTRKQTEDNLRRHVALRSAWLEQLRKWENEDRLKLARAAYFRSRYVVIPRHLALVPLGFFPPFSGSLPPRVTSNRVSVSVFGRWASSWVNSCRKST